jgi:hypothetical protein
MDGETAERAAFGAQPVQSDPILINALVAIPTEAALDRRRVNRVPMLRRRVAGPDAGIGAKRPHERVAAISKSRSAAASCTSMPPPWALMCVPFVSGQIATG